MAKDNNEDHRDEVKKELEEMAKILEEENAKTKELEAKEEKSKQAQNKMRSVTKVFSVFGIFFMPPFLFMMVLTIWNEGMWTYIDGALAIANFVIMLYMMYLNVYLTEKGRWKNIRIAQVIFWLALLVNMGSLANYIVSFT